METVCDPGHIEFMIPSGFIVRIRETNGNDEENLSKIKNAKSAESVAIFLAGIIICTDIPGQEHPTPTDIMNWKVNDKYYCLLKSRMHSLGNELRFKWTWTEHTDVPTEYLEDLTIFDRDLRIEDGLNDPNDTRIRKYPLGAAIGREIDLSSGKKVRYEFLTGVGEKRALDIPEGETSNNTELKIRNLQWKNPEGHWINVQNFGIFTSREMAAIRSDIAKYDIKFEMRIKIKNPFTDKDSYIPAIVVNDFFYPEEIV